MSRDPIVEELHRFREAHAKAMNYDLKAIFRQLKEEENASGRTFVRLSTSEPRKAQRLREEREAALVPTAKKQWTAEDEAEMEEFRETLRDVRRQENGRYDMLEGENTREGGCI